MRILQFFNRRVELRGIVIGRVILAISQGGNLLVKRGARKGDKQQFHGQQHGQHSLRVQMSDSLLAFCRIFALDNFSRKAQKLHFDETRSHLVAAQYKVGCLGFRYLLFVRVLTERESSENGKIRDRQDNKGEQTPVRQLVVDTPLLLRQK